MTNEPELKPPLISDAARQTVADACENIRRSDEKTAANAALIATSIDRLVALLAQSNQPQHPETMTPEELSQTTEIHQQVLNRHDRELASFRAEFQTLLRLSQMDHKENMRRIEATLDRVATQQAANTEAIAANSRETAALRETMHAEVDNLVQLISTLATHTDESIQRLSDTLSARFQSNGGQTP